MKSRPSAASIRNLEVGFGNGVPTDELTGRALLKKQTTLSVAQTFENAAPRTTGKPAKFEREDITGKNGQTAVLRTRRFAAARAQKGMVLANA